MLKLRLIGLPALIGNDGGASPLERKDAALLAILAIDGATARDALASMLWPDVPLKTANTSLRQRVFRLRRRCDRELVVTGTQMQLGAGIAHDARLQADEANTLPPAGDLLGSFDYTDCEALADWVRAARERWRAHRRDLLAGAAARHETAGELARAIELARQLVADDPLAEHAQRRLMRLHYLRGDRAAAIAAFETFERALKDELGTRPGAETLELLATIERAQPAAPAARRAVVPAALRRPPKMVGRDAELAALEAAWSVGRVFLVLGEAGMGKSRLLAEFAASRGDCVIAQARPGDAAVPFALLARLLRAALDHAARASSTPAGSVVTALDESIRSELARVLPELGTGAVIAGEGRRLLLQRAIEQLLALVHAQGVTALLVDDLHFADAASLDMLQSLPDAQGPAALHWGLAQRPGEGGAAAAALSDALAESQRLQPIPLAPLDTAAMRALIDSLGLPELDAAALAAPLVRHTGGNPLFALETLKDMVVAVPPAAVRQSALPQPATVGVLIERRLAQLSTSALALARVAAIAGVDFGIGLAERVLATPALMLADAWNELQSAQVLNGAMFAHDLVYEAVLRSVPPDIARHAHAAVAEQLQSQHGAPARLAAHWEAAGNAGHAGVAYRAAAREALAAGRREDEVRLLVRAAACFTQAELHDQAFEADLARVIGTVTIEGADAGLALADRLVETAHSGAQRAAALTRRAAVLQWLVRAADAAEDCRQALALIDETGGVSIPPSTSLFAVGILASSLASLGRAAEGAALMIGRASAAEACEDSEARLVFFGTLTTVLTYANRRREAIAAGERHIALARAAGRRDELLSGLTNASAANVFLGRLDDAIAMASEAHLLADSLGQDRAAAAVNAANLGWYLVAAGRYGEGLGLIEEALAALRALMPASAFVANVECFLADALLALGQPGRSAKLLSDDERLPAFLRAKRFLGRVRAARTAGRSAPDLIDRGLALAVGDAGLPVSMALRLERVRQLPAPAALALCDDVLCDAERSDAPMTRLQALCRRIEPLLAQGDAAAAHTLATQLCRDAPTVRGPGLYPPELLLAAARACAAAGRAEEERAALVTALSWIDARLARDVPPAFQDSFRNRNLVNREVRELASRSHRAQVTGE